MKLPYSVALFVAFAYAQDDPTPEEPYPVTPFDELIPLIQPYAQSLIKINDSTLALDAQIIQFQGLDQALDVLGASQTLLKTIQDETVVDQALPGLEDVDINDIIGLATYVANLGYYVNQTIDDLIDKKEAFVDACVGEVVRDQLSSQSSAASVYQSVLIGKLNPTLTDLAIQLASTIPVALASGVSAYADQTTAPASCTVTTTTSSTDSSSTDSSSTGSSVTSGSVPTSSASTRPTTTPGPTATGGHAWEIISSFYSPHTTKTTSGNVYEWSTITSRPPHPTSGSSKPVVSYSASISSKPSVSYSPSISSKPSVSYSPSISYGLSVSYVPSVSYKPSISSGPTYSSKPSGSSSPAFTTAKYPIYTGAASVNHVGRLVAAAALAVAIL